MLLDTEQKKSLAQYIWEQENCPVPVCNSCHASSEKMKNPLTEIQQGDLYLCMEHRIVRVQK